MTNNDELNQFKVLWQAVEAEVIDLQFPIPNALLSPSTAVPIPISSTARFKAAGMSDLCPYVDHRATMRRNLLATITVHDYLSFQGYLPDLRASDCWNPILGRTGEVADLVVSQVGRFECCAIDPGQPTCSVPAEGQYRRAGYVVVELDREERWGWLLGFIPSGNETEPIETLNREKLQSMDEFGNHLHRLWLLWTIVQERSEPWNVELRSDMVTLLERIYRTRSAAQRPMRAMAEITQMWGEDMVSAELREFAGGSREGEDVVDRDLGDYLRAVFDRLEDALAIEEETDNER